MSEELFKKKISKEEKLYEEAAGLQESVPCVLRFECAVQSLRGAADKFKKLASYKDSEIRMQQCLESAQRAEEKGGIEVYEAAVQMEKEAKCKSDYLEAIVNFKRVPESCGRSEEAAEHIRFCYDAIKKLQVRALRRRRGIAVLVFAVLIFCFVQSRAFPMAKGYVYRQMGEYEAAIHEFQAAEGLPYVQKLLLSSYNALGEELLEQGEKEQAFELFLKAKGNQQAEKHTAELEREFLADARQGDTVTFAQTEWNVLKREDQELLLLETQACDERVYSSKEKTAWKQSSVYSWLNKKYMDTRFTDAQQEMLLEQRADEEKESTPEYLFLLSREEYEACQSDITQIKENWWLRSEVTDDRKAEFVAADGQIGLADAAETACAVRTAVWITLQ
ncbi:MAG: DUF6273 domain-containing protein [Clostridiaceae bacterium]|nr:DUF6273 domain-containing protein [Clostridiaceae bacterium]